MDDDSLAALPCDPAARARWVHDLRNAVNALGVGARLAQRLIEKDRPDDARTTLTNMIDAWERCRDLLAHAPEATGLLPAPPENGRDGPSLHRPD